MGQFEIIGTSIGKLVDEKNQKYGNSFGDSGIVVREIFPDGVTPARTDDVLFVARVLDKLFRIGTDKDAFGESPAGDIYGYCILQINKDEGTPHRQWKASANYDVVKSMKVIFKQGIAPQQLEDALDVMYILKELYKFGREEGNNGVTPARTIAEHALYMKDRHDKEKAARTTPQTGTSSGWVYQMTCSYPNCPTICFMTPSQRPANCPMQGSYSYTTSTDTKDCGSTSSSCGHLHSVPTGEYVKLNGTSMSGTLMTDPLPKLQPVEPGSHERHMRTDMAFDYPVLHAATGFDPAKEKAMMASMRLMALADGKDGFIIEEENGSRRWVSIKDDFTYDP